MSIGERITELRTRKNLSQGELASALSVSRQAISKWENDQSSPDTIHLIQLADFLDTEVAYLATGVKPVYEEAPIVVNLVKKEDRVVEVEKVVEKPVIRRIVRVNTGEIHWNIWLWASSALCWGCFWVSLYFDRKYEKPRHGYLGFHLNCSG